MEFSNFFEAQPTEICATESTFHVITTTIFLFQDEATTSRTWFGILTGWFKLLQCRYGLNNLIVYVFTVVSDYTPRLIYTLGRDAMFAYICSSILCHSLDVDTQISFDRWTLSPEGVQRMDNLVLDMIGRLVPLPAIGESFALDTEQTPSHSQETVSKHNLF